MGYQYLMEKLEPESTSPDSVPLLINRKQAIPNKSELSLNFVLFSVLVLAPGTIPSTWVKGIIESCQLQSAYYMEKYHFGFMGAQCTNSSWKAERFI